MDIPDNVCRTKSYAVHVNDFYFYDMIIYENWVKTLNGLYIFISN